MIDFRKWNNIVRNKLYEKFDICLAERGMNLSTYR